MNNKKLIIKSPPLNQKTTKNNEIKALKIFMVCLYIEYIAASL